MPLYSSSISIKIQPYISEDDFIYTYSLVDDDENTLIFEIKSLKYCSNKIKSIIKKVTNKIVKDKKPKINKPI
jgi:hypothetical protein